MGCGENGKQLKCDVDVNASARATEEIHPPIPAAA